VLTLLLVGAPLVASADTLVVLPVQGKKLPRSLQKELHDALKAAKRAFKSSPLALPDLMLAVECSKTTVGCLQKIGSSLGATSLLLSTGSVSTDGYQLELRWFDVKNGGDLGDLSLTLPRKNRRARARLLRQRLPDLFAAPPKIAPAPKAVIKAPVGELRITASAPRVEISIDGESRGSAPLSLRGLPLKTYSVVATQEGVEVWRGEAKVTAGTVTRLEIEVPVRELLSDNQRPGFLDSVRLQTWLVAGVGAACVATALAFGAHMRAQQNELDGLRGDTFEEIAQMQAAKDSGDRDALIANIMFGIGGGAVIAAAVMSYFDYRAASRRGAVKAAVGPGSVSLHISF